MKGRSESELCGGFVCCCVSVVFGCVGDFSRRSGC